MSSKELSIANMAGSNKKSYKRDEFRSEEEERKWMEERRFEYIGEADDFKIPEWMDCAWRRVACGKNDCKICGKIKEDRFYHIMKGEDPDSMANVFEDVGSSLSETLAMIKRDAAERGIDIENITEDELEEPPVAETFPLYQQIAEWHQQVSRPIQDAELNGNAWLLTEAAADLIWYRSTLLVKTYRQLCNRWHLDRGDEYGDFDYEYTKYVLKECVEILKKALMGLSIVDPIHHREELWNARTRLKELEKPIFAI